MSKHGGNKLKFRDTLNVGCVKTDYNITTTLFFLRRRYPLNFSNLPTVMLYQTHSVLDTHIYKTKNESHKKDTQKKTIV